MKNGNVIIFLFILGCWGSAEATATQPRGGSPSLRDVFLKAKATQKPMWEHLWEEEASPKIKPGATGITSTSASASNSANPYDAIVKDERFQFAKNPLNFIRSTGMEAFKEIQGYLVTGDRKNPKDRSKNTLKALAALKALFPEEVQASLRPENIGHALEESALSSEKSLSCRNLAEELLGKVTYLKEALETGDFFTGENKSIKKMFETLTSVFDNNQGDNIKRFLDVSLRTLSDDLPKNLKKYPQRLPEALTCLRALYAKIDKPLRTFNLIATKPPTGVSQKSQDAYAARIRDKASRICDLCFELITKLEKGSLSTSGPATATPEGAAALVQALRDATEKDAITAAVNGIIDHYVPLLSADERNEDKAVERTNAYLKAFAHLVIFKGIFEEQGIKEEEQVRLLAKMEANKLTAAADDDGPPVDDLGILGLNDTPDRKVGDTPPAPAPNAPDRSSDLAERLRRLNESGTPTSTPAAPELPAPMPVPTTPPMSPEEKAKVHADLDDILGTPPAPGLAPSTPTPPPAAEEFEPFSSGAPSSSHTETSAPTPSAPDLSAFDATPAIPLSPGVTSSRLSDFLDGVPRTPAQAPRPVGEITSPVAQELFEKFTKVMSPRRNSLTPSASGAGSETPASGPQADALQRALIFARTGTKISGTAQEQFVQLMDYRCAIKENDKEVEDKHTTLYAQQLNTLEAKIKALAPAYGTTSEIDYRLGLQDVYIERQKAFPMAMRSSETSDINDAITGLEKLLIQYKDTQHGGYGKRHEKGALWGTNEVRDTLFPAEYAKLQEIQTALRAAKSALAKDDAESKLTGTRRGRRASSPTS